MAAGDSHSAALTANGFLFAWGANEKGQLGLPRAAEAAAQVQRTASERQCARRVVNQRFLTAMLEMGIPLDKAELVLSETGNVGVEGQAASLQCPLWCTHTRLSILVVYIGSLQADTGTHCWNGKVVSW